jgi:hypothetical protein
MFTNTQVARVATPEQPIASSTQRISLLQRQCACGQHTMAGGECAECGKKPLASQRASLSPRGRGTEAEEKVPPSVHEILRSPGQRLDAATRAFFEPHFGHDFSRVRVHTDAKAAESAQAVNALAYTVGRDVVFGMGQYAPHTTSGRQLLAHELTHVVQQAGIYTKPSLNMIIGSVNSPLEREAKHTAAYIKQIDTSTMAEDNFPTNRLKGNQYHPISMHTVPPDLLQRQEVCEPQGSESGIVVYDYENQVCRQAEPAELERSAPESDPVDGEFWMLPVGVREGSRPVIDDEDTNVVIAFRYSSGGYYEVYDLEGTFVESGEPGLESPLIDPIDILAGGLTGLGRGLFGGGGRAVLRGVAGGAGRGAAASVGRAGLLATIRLLSRRAIVAVRGVYRAIRFRGPLSFTGTTAARMADPTRRVPHHILKLAIRFGARSPDPQGVAGAFRYVIPMFRNGRQYTLEVVIREADKTVLHFLYR